MKRIYKLGWIISGILLLAGCDISNRDNNLSESLVYFINEGENNLVLYNTCTRCLSLKADFLTKKLM